MKSISLGFLALVSVSCARHPNLGEVRTMALPKWKDAFAVKQIAYPPERLLIRAFKKEKILELWAKPHGKDQYRLLKSYPILAASGVLGPKRKEGDRQVPEGVYAVEGLNPMSSYHLSMKVDYPNRSDRILSDSKKPGGDIFIHGKSVSIGCIAIGDAAIEEVYSLVEEVRSRSKTWPVVLIFPCSLDSRSWTELKIASIKRPDLIQFWDGLKTIFDKFEQSHVMPAIKVDSVGRYIIKKSPNKHNQLNTKPIGN